MGAVDPQSALLRQATQVWLRTRQRGSPAGQSLFASQATQVFDVGSQIGAGAAQSLFVLQPTHVPSELQIFPPARTQDAVVQAVWQS